MDARLLLLATMIPKYRELSTYLSPSICADCFFHSRDIIRAQMFGHNNIDMWNFIGEFSVDGVKSGVQPLDNDLLGREAWEVDVDTKTGILGGRIATGNIDLEQIEEWEAKGS